MYRLDNKKIDLEKSTLIGTGKNSNIYKVNKEMVKVYSDIDDEIIDIDTVRKLKTISTDYVLLPKRVLYYKDKYKGYSLKYISKVGSINNILTDSKEKLVENFRVLENDILMLSSKGVLLDGITPDNVIYNNGLYISDPKRYLFLDCDTTCLYNLNNYQLNLLINNIIVNGLKKNKIDSESLKEFKKILENKKDVNLSSYYNEMLDGEDNIKNYVKRLGK